MSPARVARATAPGPRAAQRKTYWHVDAFTTERYRGNPAAVVFEAEGLSSERMQEIAREMNLSETVFVLEPEDRSASYRVRIFTPRSELPFAGHPTLAAAFAMLESGRARPRDGVLRQECGIGVLPVDVAAEGGVTTFTMTQGRPEHRDAELGAALAAEMLGCRTEDLGSSPAEIASTGLPWLIVPIRSLEAMQSLRPDLNVLERVCRGRGAVGVTAFCEGAAHPGCRYRLRSFAPGEGVAEDPVCGSGNGSTAAYLARHRFAREERFEYCAEQGVELGRDGLVRVSGSRAGGKWTIRVGGAAALVAEGSLIA